MWRLKSTTTSFFFSFRILSIFNTHTHTQGEGRRFFKETYSDIYPKWPNSWIHNTGFKPRLLTLIFQCGINPLFFFFKILNIFNTHTHREKGEGFLKKLTMVYIQKRYTTQALNLLDTTTSFYLNKKLTKYPIKKILEVSQN